MNKIKITEDEIVEQLGQITGEDYTRDYEMAIAKVSEFMSISKKDIFYIQKIDELVDAGKLQHAYNIFYALCTYHRRHLNLTQNSQLVNEYRRTFSHFSSFKFLEHLSQKLNPHISSEQIIKDAKLMTSDVKLMQNPGVTHSYCESVAEFLDEHTEKIADNAELLKYATESMHSLLSHDTYPKFFCTYGRLLTLDATLNVLDKNSEAVLNQGVAQISVAIDQENPETPSYSIKINQYQSHILNAKQRYYSSRLQSELVVAKKEFEDKTSELNVKNMEFLAFFIGVISFTLGSLNLATFDTFEDNARLVVVLMGALMISFSCFGFILYGFSNKNRIISNSAVIVVGFLLLLLAPTFYI